MEADPLPGSPWEDDDGTFGSVLTGRLRRSAEAVGPVRARLADVERDSRRRRSRRHATVAGATASLAIALVVAAGALLARPPQSVVAAGGPVAPSDHTEGQRLWAENCSACHGTTGDGGAGRQVSDGEVLRTFPDREDELAYVRKGDVGPGPYGSPSRPGGQHVAPYDGSFMPGFPTLTDEELLAVVRYEREVLSGEQP